MLADAYSQFLSPCLTVPALVNYGANFPGWLAIFAALTVQLIEYGAMTRHYSIIEKKRNCLPIVEKVDVDDTRNDEANSDNQLTLEDAVGHLRLPGFEDSQEVCNSSQFSTAYIFCCNSHNINLRTLLLLLAQSCWKPV